MRLFIGIPLSAEATKEISRLSMRLHSLDDNLRWSAPESWHITLQFLGNSSHEQYQCIVAQLRKIVLPPASINFEFFGVFARAGIFYLGVKTTNWLITLHQSVTAATAPCGFIAEERPYHPHITLARSKGTQGIRSMSRLKARIPHDSPVAGFLPQNFILYESFTGSSGSRYEVREHFAFNKH